MKSAMLRAALVSMMAVVPAISFAQATNAANGNGPLTRAQVIQELVDLESVGYNPSHVSDATYPQDVQAAMQRVAEKRANAARVAQQQAAQSGYGNAPEQGGEAGGRAVAAVRVVPGEAPPSYLHH